MDELPLSKIDSFYISSPEFNLLFQASGIFSSSKPVYILWLIQKKKLNFTSSMTNQIPYILCKPMVHYHVHDSLPFAPLYFSNNHYNFISPMRRSTKWSQPKHCTNFFFPYISHMPRPSHPPWFDHPNNIWWGILIMKLHIMHFFSPVFCKLLSSYIQISNSVTYSQTPSYCVRGKASHTYIKQGKL